MVKRDIIVVGASAGGVNALIQLIQNLPPELAASLLIVIHRPAEGSSVLAEVLQYRTRLVVITPKNGQIIRQGHIYLAPQNYHMTTKDGRVYLTYGPKVNYNRPAIDPLFRSAAINYGHRVIGIILSGELDDGTVGLGLIKNFGGITIVQDPVGADHPSMPRNALENVKIDYCLSLPEIAPLIEKLLKAPVKAKIKAAPKSVLLETQSATKTFLTPLELNELGKISTFTCPECHGNLWEIDTNQLLRYRCRIGHAYSPDNLLIAHDDTTENTLWSAVRALEENAELSERIAKRTELHHPLTKNLFQEKALIARKNAKKMKEMLFKNKKMISSVPEEESPNEKTDAS